MTLQIGVSRKSTIWGSIIKGVSKMDWIKFLPHEEGIEKIGKEAIVSFVLLFLAIHGCNVGPFKGTGGESP